MTEQEKTSNLWYLIPIFFGLIGGIIVRIVLAKKNPRMARNCLLVGGITTIISASISAALRFALRPFQGYAKIRIVDYKAERYDADPSWFYVDYKTRITVTLENFGDNSVYVTLKFKVEMDEGDDYKIVTTFMPAHSYKDVVCEDLVGSYNEFRYWVQILKIEA